MVSAAFQTLDSVLAKLYGNGLSLVADSLGAWAHGMRGRRVLSKTYTSTVVLSGTQSDTRVFPQSDLQNSRYPFVLEEIHLHEDADESSQFLVQIRDLTTGEDIFTPSRIVSALLEGNGFPSARTTAACKMHGHIIPPTGGLEVLLETVASTGSPSTVYFTMRGYWIITDDPEQFGKVIKGQSKVINRLKGAFR